MSDVKIHEPSKEQIERRAYEIYLGRGGEHGSDVADWIMAEQELRALANTSTSATTRKSHQAQHAKN